MRFVTATLVLICLALPCEAAAQQPADSSAKGPGRLSSRLALSIGTPGGLNACFAGWGQKGLGYRLTAGYMQVGVTGHIAGVQAELLRRAREKGATLSDFSIGIGYSEIYTDWATGFWSSNKYTKFWRYAGLFYNLNSHSFFLQVGLTVGSGDYTSPQLALQIGVSLFSWHAR